MIDFILQNAGKDKDEHYDLKSELLSNLGDDVINYEKAPTGQLVLRTQIAAVHLFDRLAQSRQTCLRADGGPGHHGARAPAASKTANFSAGTIHTVTLGAPDNAAAPTVQLLRQRRIRRDGQRPRNPGGIPAQQRQQGKTLMETAGLADSAQNVGGLSTGWFGFENQNQDMRPMFDLLRKQRPPSPTFSERPPIAGNINVAEQVVSKLLDWSDFSLLPPFDAVSKYFYYSVYAGRFSPEGFTSKSSPRRRPRCVESDIDRQSLTLYSCG